MGKSGYKIWVARVLITVVFVINVFGALQFIFIPEQFLSAYELSGVSGTYALQGLGITFLMWNATYPAVIVQPQRFRALFVVMLVQQVIGLTGESTLLAMLSAADHANLFSSIVRFIVFDSLDFVLLIVAFILSHKRKTDKEDKHASIQDIEQVTSSDSKQIVD